MHIYFFYIHLNQNTRGGPKWGPKKCPSWARTQGSRNQKNVGKRIPRERKNWPGPASHFGQFRFGLDFGMLSGPFRAFSRLSMDTSLGSAWLHLGGLSWHLTGSARGFFWRLWGSSRWCVLRLLGGFWKERSGQLVFVGLAEGSIVMGCMQESAHLFANICKLCDSRIPCSLAHGPIRGVAKKLSARVARAWF